MIALAGKNGANISKMKERVKKWVQSTFEVRDKKCFLVSHST
jgi:hypothetical protein